MIDTYQLFEGGAFVLIIALMIVAAMRLTRHGKPDRIYWRLKWSDDAAKQTELINKYMYSHCLVVDGRIYVGESFSNMMELPADAEWLPAEGFNRNDYK